MSGLELCLDYVISQRYWCLRGGKLCSIRGGMTLKRKNQLCRDYGKYPSETGFIVFIVYSVRVIRAPERGLFANCMRYADALGIVIVAEHPAGRRPSGYRNRTFSIADQERQQWCRWQ